MRDTAPYSETKETLPASANAPPAELSGSAMKSRISATKSRISPGPIESSRSSAGELADRLSPLDFRRVSLTLESLRLDARIWIWE